MLLCCAYLIILNFFLILRSISLVICCSRCAVCLVLLTGGYWHKGSTTYETVEMFTTSLLVKGTKSVLGYFLVHLFQDRVIRWSVYDGSWCCAWWEG